MNSVVFDDLWYGQIGQPSFIEDDKEWKLLRVPGIRYVASPIGEAVQTLPGTRELSSNKTTQYGTERERNIRKATAAEPTLTAAESVLPRLTQVSEAVIDTSITYDPLATSLMAFGTAADLENSSSGTRSINIVAVAGGASGEHVRFCRLNKDHWTWDGKKGFHIVVPSVEGKEAGAWLGKGAPILGIHYSESTYGPAAWLAVRYPNYTAIFRPILNRKSNSLQTSYLQSTRISSLINPNWILDLSIRKTGNATHSDLSFNPWDNHIFATVDLYGSWSTWKIPFRTRGRDNSRLLEAVSRGVISQQQDEENVSDAVEDGWGRVIWSSNDMLLVFTRTTGGAYRINEKTKEAICVDLSSRLALGRISGQILDALRISFYPACVLILTTIRIIYLSIDTTTDDFRPSSIRIPLSWRHHRTPNDPSMRLFLLGTDGALVVALVAQKTNVSTVYSLDASDPRTPRLLSDPFVLENSVSTGRASRPRIDGSTGSFQSASKALCFRECSYISRINNSSFDPGDKFRESCTSLAESFSLRKDFSISQRTLIIRPSHTALPQLPNVRIRNAARAMYSASANTVVDDFAVPDGQNSEDGMFASEQETWRHLQNQQLGVEQKAISRKLKLSKATESMMLCRDAQKARSRILSVDDDLATSITAVAGALDHVVKVLQDVLPDEIITMDMGSVAAALEDLLETIPNTLHNAFGQDNEPSAPRPSVTVASLSTIALDLREGRAMAMASFQAIYERLLQFTVSCLPTSAFGRCRMIAESITRSETLRLFLSAHTILPSLDSVQLNRVNPLEAEPSEAMLPNRKGGPTSSLPLDSSSGLQTNTKRGKGKDRASFDEPAISPTPESKRSSYAQSPPLTDNPPASRSASILSYLIPCQDPPKLHSIPRKILSSWMAGHDPSTYVYQTPQDAFTGENDRFASLPEPEKWHPEKQRKRLKLQTDLSTSRSLPNLAMSSHLQEMQATQGLGSLRLSPSPTRQNQDADGPVSSSIRRPGHPISRMARRSGFG